MRVFLIIIIFLLTLFHSQVQAEYVFPYPSYMPGNKLYIVSRAADKLKAYWYWGTIASIKYHLSLSDKYLVEAKTLFEYKQYPLALDALMRSDKQVLRLTRYLSKLQQEDKTSDNLMNLLPAAMTGHRVLLSQLKRELPSEFIWQDEYVEPKYLKIHQAINVSIDIRDSLEKSF